MFVSGRRSYDWVVIRGYYEGGKTARECQQRFGFSNGAWHCAVQREDIILRPGVGPAHKPRGRTRRAVERLLAEGIPQAQIAATLGVSRPTVAFHVRQLGIPARPELARRFEWPEIRAYYEAGHSVNECQRRFGFSRAAWADAVRRAAVKPRPRAEPLEPY